MKTTPTISEKIKPILDELYAFGYQDGMQESEEHPHHVQQARTQLLSILADFAEHITPEKKNPSKYSANEDPYEHNRELGFDFAVDEITKRTKEYLL